MNTFKNNWAVNNKPERKRKNLIRLGVEQEMAYQWSRSRMGGWAIAQSPILGTTITLKRLCKEGYESILTYYEKVARPPAGGNRCIRDPYVQWCERLSPSV
jgi:hypothetical protein